MRVDRFDHAVIAVSDLDAAVDSYRELGFDVSLGGRHTGRGTHNAIIRFGLDYLELIAVHDRMLGMEHGGNVNDLIAFLDRTGGGLIGFALATSDLDAMAANWSSNVAPMSGILPMERVRPGGFRLQWRLLIPGGSAWRRPWPFLIQWDTPDNERLERDGHAAHPNGARSVVGARVVARSLQAVLPLYTKELGMTPQAGVGPELTLAVGGFAIALDQPDNGPAEESLEREGEGLYEVHLSVSDLQKAAAVTGATPDSQGQMIIPAGRACGARLVLVAAG